MTFPVAWDFAGRSIHAHGVLEVLAYALGAQIYRLTRTRYQRLGQLPNLPADAGIYLITAAIIGAYLGSKLLAFAESPAAYWAHRTDFRLLFQGKTIAGGLLGAWIGVELVKSLRRLPHRTGDAFVPALTFAIPVGRLGCFLEGLPDHTCGLPSSLPWAVDFGDHIPRHPAQLYEAATVLVLGMLILALSRPSPAGRQFRLFMLGYLTFRVLVEFIKPRDFVLLSLSPIQWAALAGAITCTVQLRKPFRPTSQHLQ